MPGVSEQRELVRPGGRGEMVADLAGGLTLGGIGGKMRPAGGETITVRTEPPRATSPMSEQALQ